MRNKMQMHTEKVDIRKDSKALLFFCNPYKKSIYFAFVFAIAGSILTVVSPSYLSDITDIILTGLSGEMDIDGIFSIAGFMIFLYVTSFVLSYLQVLLMASTTQNLVKNLRKDVKNKLDRLPLKYFDTNSFGDILSRLTNDIDTIGQTLNQSLSGLVSAVCLLLGTVVMMAWSNAILAIVAIVSSLVGFVFMALIMSKSQKFFALQQGNLGEMNGHIEEIYSGHKIVRAYNNEKSVTADFDKINIKLRHSEWKSQFLSGLMMPIMNFTGNFSYVCVCLTGAYLAVEGHITFGVIVEFMVYIRLFTQPLSQIAQGLNNLQLTIASSKRVYEIVTAEEMVKDSVVHSLSNIKGEVIFSNVTFGYQKEKVIIDNFSAHIKPGQKIAIVGPTGSGKTTIVNLLMRFYDIDAGTIKIDGISIMDVSRENLRDNFCMVLQDTWIFEGSVRENIVYNNENISDERLIEIAKAAGIHHHIKTLPYGYDTILNENVSLSEGQKQLFTIARAMVKNAPILILDEATSSVDTRIESIIQKAMDNLMKERTSFVIAHRLTTIKNSDVILVLKDGVLIEEGNHDKLVEKGGFYADLYNSQFDNA